MVGLWYRCPDAGLEVKPCRLAILLYVRIRDRLQVPETEHLDIGLKQPAIWDRPRYFFESQSLLGDVEFQEPVLTWLAVGPPDDIEASPSPGSLQTCKQPKWIVGSVDRRKPQRSVDRGYRRKGKVWFELHFPLSIRRLRARSTFIIAANSPEQEGTGDPTRGYFHWLPPSAKPEGHLEARTTRTQPPPSPNRQKRDPAACARRSLR